MIMSQIFFSFRFLATGDSILFISLDHRIGESTCYKIIKETSNVIYKILSPVYLKVPSIQDWKDISDGFLYE